MSTPKATLTTSIDATIIQSKAFHHNNLHLRIILDSLNFYSIEIFRVNDSTTANLWGCFMSLKDAQKKFDTISL